MPNNPNSGEVGSVGEQRDYSHVPRWKQILSLVVLIAIDPRHDFRKTDRY
ncbi:hypothetical protein LNO81_26520 [Klebsiella variicola subsp. variicola]|nr:hypothetical protein [Klebsiella variicola subsp. variicola]